MKSKYIYRFFCQDLCPEKVSDYIRVEETLSVRPIFGPSYCSHTTTTTTIKAFLSSPAICLAGRDCLSGEGGNEEGRRVRLSGYYTRWGL